MQNDWNSSTVCPKNFKISLQIRENPEVSKISKWWKPLSIHESPSKNIGERVVSG
jgi:hypothetical protein